MTQQPYTTQTGSPFWRAVGKFFKFLLYLIMVIVLGVSVGAGLYYGVPWAYRSLVQPVQNNTAQLASLEQKLDQDQARVGEELQTFQTRIVDLETERAQLQEDVTAQTQELQTQAEVLQAADARIQQLEQRVTQAEQDLGTQQEAVAALGKALEQELAAITGQGADARLQLQGLESRLALIQTAQDLLKVRLLLLEENPRAAQDTVLLAVEHLKRAATASPELADTLAPLQERMAALEGLIKEDSFRVGPELESLWADVMDLVLPPLVHVETAEETVLISPLPTPTPPAP